MSNEIYNQMMQEREQLQEQEMPDDYAGSPHFNPYGDGSGENIVRWQLDLSEDLDRIYHLLHGHRIVIDKDGNVKYEEPTDVSLKPFNEYGVQLIMNILSFYLNRNTILSNYDEKTIKLKVYDFGIAISDLIFTKYQEMGMDTDEKRKMYTMICRELIDTVHSAYMRAFNGGERTSIRKSIHYSEVGNSNMHNGNLNAQVKGGAKWYNPLSWA